LQISPNTFRGHRDLSTCLQLTGAARLDGLQGCSPPWKI